MKRSKGRARDIERDLKAAIKGQGGRMCKHTRASLDSVRNWSNKITNDLNKGRVTRQDAINAHKELGE